MGLGGLITGVGIFLLTMFISVIAPTSLPDLSTSAVAVLQVFLLFIGISSVFVGAISK